MKSESLWTIPPAAVPSKSTESAVKILNEQAQYLGAIMGGKVEAAFHTMPDYYGPDYEYELVLNGKSRDNADELYSYQRYAFDIFNSSYLFRLLTIDLPPFYPFQCNVDRDVLDEAEKEYKEKIGGKRNANNMMEVSVGSDSDLKDILKMLFSTRKVRFMLYKLRQQSEEAEKKGA